MDKRLVRRNKWKKRKPIRKINIKNCEGSKILSYLQSATALWLLTEDARFLGQRQRLLLTVIAVALGLAVSCAGFLSSLPMGQR